MWEADLDTVDETISDSFKEDERLMVSRVENDLLKFALVISQYMYMLLRFICKHTRRALMSSMLTARSVSVWRSFCAGRRNWSNSVTSDQYRAQVVRER